jgi:hypothetical protein
MTGRRLRAVMLCAALVAGFVVAVGGSLVLPLRLACPPEIYTDQVCSETVAAAMERGLPGIHPLILAAEAAPGPDHNKERGLRDVVTFSMLGVPGGTTVELHFDMSAHWGGVTSRGEAELAVWTAAVSLVAGLLAAGVVRALAALLGRRAG